jgi:hypothetical protein
MHGPLSAINHPFSLEELKDLKKVIEDDLSSLPDHVQLIRKYGRNTDNKLYLSLVGVEKLTTNEIFIPEDFIKDASVLTDQFENMPLYLNSPWLKRLIAKWRLSICK